MEKVFALRKINLLTVFRLFQRIIHDKLFSDPLHHSGPEPDGIVILLQYAAVFLPMDEVAAAGKADSVPTRSTFADVDVIHIVYIFPAEDPGIPLALFRGFVKHND